jgi:hypothetical protein
MTIQTSPRVVNILGRVILVIVALAIALPVWFILNLFAIGFGDPGKQIFLPEVLFWPQLLLSFTVPWITAISLGWWSHLAVKIKGKLSWRALLGIAWIVLLCLDELDHEWSTVGFPPPGQIWLVNRTPYEVTYTTTPALSDEVAMWTEGAPLSPGYMRALNNVPSTGQIAIRVAEDGGQLIFCRVASAADLLGYSGRIDVEVDPASCASSRG